jgi:hypothetical protein
MDADAPELDELESDMEDTEIGGEVEDETEW